MPEGGPALVHDLRLALRVEVLRDLAHDAHHLALPGLQQGGVLFDEVQDVFLRLGREALGLQGQWLLAGAHRQGAPQLVDLLLRVGFALGALLALPCQALLGGTAVAVHPEVGQRVARVQELLHRLQPMALLALGDEVLGIDQVVDDAGRVCPHAEQVIALEEAVVPIGRMGDHQRLHGSGVFFHEVADAGVGVDDDFVGQSHVPTPVAPLGGQKLLAVAPVPVVHGHAHAGIGVHHLLGSDDLQLVGVGVQPEALGRGGNGAVVALDQLKRPVTGVGQRLHGALPWGQRRLRHHAVAALAHGGSLPGVVAQAALQHGVLGHVHTCTPSFLKRSRKTG